MRQPVILVAASGLAREVMAAVNAAGTHEIVGLLDDDRALHGTSFADVPVLGGSVLAIEHRAASFVVCAGSGRVRAGIAVGLMQAGIRRERFATVVHPSAVVTGTSRIGVGSVLLAHVTLTADVTVGDHVVLMPSVVLTHDDLVADFATLCAGVALGGSVRVGRAAYLGMNASVRENLRIGNRAILGMGSVLLQDLPEDKTWAGVPAAPIRRCSQQGVLAPVGEGGQ